MSFHRKSASHPKSPLRIGSEKQSSSDEENKFKGLGICLLLLANTASIMVTGSHGLSALNAPDTVPKLDANSFGPSSHQGEGHYSNHESQYATLNDFNAKIMAHAHSFRQPKPTTLAEDEEEAKKSKKKTKTSKSTDSDTESDLFSHSDDGMLSSSATSQSVSTARVSSIFHSRPLTTSPTSSIISTPRSYAATTANILFSAALSEPQQTVTTVGAKILEFCNFTDLAVVRQVSQVFVEAAEAVAPENLGFADKDAMTFIRWNPPQIEQLANNRLPMANENKAALKWRCIKCSTLNVPSNSDELAAKQRCAGCQSSLTSAACRVFVGQLRRSQTANVVSSMIRMLCPSVNPLYIESHTTNEKRGGREKGCAWVYVDSVADMEKLMTLHKRCFGDADEFNREGYWFLKKQDAEAAFQYMVETMAGHESRSLTLPKQPLTVEYPKLLKAFLDSQSSGMNKVPTA